MLRRRHVRNDFSGSARTVVQAGQIKVLHVYGILPVRLTRISRLGLVGRLLVAFAMLAGGLALLRAATADARPLAVGVMLLGCSALLLVAYALGTTTWQRWRLSIGRYDVVLGEQVRAATSGLAEVLAKEWAREERLRRLQDPFPLPVRWENADRLADHWQVIRTDPADARPIELAGSLGSGRDIGAVFDEVPSRRLVVVGEAGAGKSVIALRLAQDRLTRRRTDEDPVPVIFSLASWDPGLDFWEWIARRLALDHPELAAPVGVGSTLAAELVRARRIAPVLDGFDEMPAALRERALPVLNSALDAPTAVLLTSRTGEYADAVRRGDVLTGAAAVELRPLSTTELVAYLPLTAKPAGADRTTKWEPVLARLRARSDDPANARLLRVLTTPLMTSLARAAYSDTDADPAELLGDRFRTRADIEEHLLDRFLPSVYDGRELADAHRWLGSLAREVAADGAEDIAWWAIGSRISVWAGRVAGVLACAAAIAAVASLPFGRLHYVHGTMVIPFLVLGLSAVAVGAQLRQERGNPVRPGAVASWTLAGGAVGVGLWFLGRAEYLPVWLVFALFSLPVVAGGTAVELRDRPTPMRLRALRPLPALGLAGVLVGWVLWRLAGVPLGFVMVALLYAVGGVALRLRAPGDVASSDPRALLRSDRTAAFILSPMNASPRNPAQVYVAALTAAPAVLLMVWSMTGGRDGTGTAEWVTTGLVVLAITFGYGLSCTAWARFAATRVVLAGAGRLPWRTMRFLADAHRRGVLRRSGGSYQFRHSRLREHLAGDGVVVPRPSRLAGATDFGRRWAALAVGIWALFAVLMTAFLPGRPGPYVPEQVAPRIGELRAMMTGLVARPAACRPPAPLEETGTVWLCESAEPAEALTLEVGVLGPSNGYTAVNWAGAVLKGDSTSKQTTRDPRFLALAGRDPQCDWRHVRTRTNTDEITEVEMMLQCQNLLVRVHYLGRPHISLAQATRLGGDVLGRTAAIAVPRS